MLSYSIMMNAFGCIQITSILLLLGSGDINHLEAIKCYTCGEANIFLGSNYTSTSPHSCRDFESSNQEALQKFIIECPPDYVGCITQIQGDQTIRTCDTFAIDDCQTANGVTYCYCNYDLCNGQMNVIRTKIQRSMMVVEDASSNNYNDKDESEILSDDEDYVEMSGFGERKNNNFDANTHDKANTHGNRQDERKIIDDDFVEINTTETIQTIPEISIISSTISSTTTSGHHIQKNNFQTNSPSYIDDSTVSPSTTPPSASSSSPTTTTAAVTNTTISSIHNYSSTARNQIVYDDESSAGVRFSLKLQYVAIVLIIRSIMIVEQILIEV